jgi:hypothetical protein
VCRWESLPAEFARGNDGHPWAELAHVIHNMSRENDSAVAAQRRKKIQKAIALRRVKAGGRLVDNNQAGIAEQSLRDAEALLHAAGISR